MVKMLMGARMEDITYQKYSEPLLVLLSPSEQTQPSRAFIETDVHLPRARSFGGGWSMKKYQCL
jgi:hypothetical protein